MVPFSTFLEVFPPTDLPFAITSETHHELSEMLLGFPPECLVGYVVAPDAEVDEFTEFLACFRFSVTAKIVGVVWWKADLEGNDFMLQTYLVNGEKIAEIRLAGTRYTEMGLVHTVATIGRDLEVFVKDDLGRMDLQVLLDETEGSVKRFHIQDDGQISEVPQ